MRLTVVLKFTLDYNYYHAEILAVIWITDKYKKENMLNVWGKEFVIYLGELGFLFSVLTGG